MELPSVLLIPLLRLRFPNQDLPPVVLLHHTRFDVFAFLRIGLEEKDLQIALLRQKLRLLERKSRSSHRLFHPEKLMLVALTTRLKTQTRRFDEALREAVFLVQPDTLLKWHRDLVRRKWTFQHPNRGGRPRLDVDIERLIIRTPFRAPKANAVAQHWVRSIRQECLDQLLILNQRHLIGVLKEYTHYYNTARPHQGLDQQFPIPHS